MKNSQLEKENYKIDKDLSLAEKSKNGREAHGTTNLTGQIIFVIKKQIDGPWKDAFVREYIDEGNMDGIIPKHLIWEQLFNRNAVLNLWLQTKLPSYEQMEITRCESSEKHQESLKNNFQKNWENMFPWSRDPNVKEFSGIGRGAYCWLSDGGRVEINKYTVFRSNDDPCFGFSVRLLKD